MNKRHSYNDESIKLAKAIDIAIESYKKFAPEIWSEQIIAHVISCHLEWKDIALNPQTKFKKKCFFKVYYSRCFYLFSREFREMC